MDSRQNKKLGAEMELEMPALWLMFPDLAAILVFGSILGPFLFLLFWPRKDR